FSHKDNIGRWFRELQYYGFVVMETGACLGVNGTGKAPHYRLTEEWHLGKPPTRDFMSWDGARFSEQKSPKHYLSKKQNPVPPVRTTRNHPSGTAAAVTDANGAESVPPVRDIQRLLTVPPVRYITSLTTPCPDTEPVTARSAPLVPAVGDVLNSTWIDD